MQLKKIIFIIHCDLVLLKKYSNAIYHLIMTHKGGKKPTL